VRDAVVEVSDDIRYSDALLKLCEEHEFYEAKRQACFKVKKQFYDTSRLGTLKSILTAAKAELSTGILQV